MRLSLIFILLISVSVGSNLGSSESDLFLQDYTIDFYEVAETDQEKENKEEVKKFSQTILIWAPNNLYLLNKLSFRDTNQQFDFSSYQGQIDLPPELL